ncbi:hypothetical protein TNCV_615171 [Trichonephila clavipes]|nr:hypothetical protein TNCV_615171 [Trichonephila clavipes]
MMDRGLARVDIDIVYSGQPLALKNNFMGTLTPSGMGLKTPALRSNQRFFHQRYERIRGYLEYPHVAKKALFIYKHEDPKPTAQQSASSVYVKMDVRIYDLATLQHRSTNHYEKWHVYVFFVEKIFLLFLAADLQQVALQYINFCTIQSSSNCQLGRQK